MSGTSQRTLALLALLQARRDWPGQHLAQRLNISPRSVRRDIDRLRALGYPITTTKGPNGGYRLEAGADLPPLLFDDEQAIALAAALQWACTTGAGVGEAGTRALATLRQVMPVRLRQRIDAAPVAVLPAVGLRPPDVEPAVLLALADAVRARQVLRLDYDPPWAGSTGSAGVSAAPSSAAPAAQAPESVTAQPRRVEPHHVVLREGRWYLLAWDLDREDWRTFRVDRVRPRIPLGSRFTPRDVPGGDVAAFVAARFKGATGPDLTWPCVGSVVLQTSAASVEPYVGDATLHVLAADRCRLTAGSWSWASLAASIARYDVEFEVVGPPALRDAVADLARRYLAGATPAPPDVPEGEHVVVAEE